MPLVREITPNAQRMLDKFQVQYEKSFKGGYGEIYRFDHNVPKAAKDGYILYYFILRGEGGNVSFLVLANVLMLDSELIDQIQERFSKLSMRNAVRFDRYDAEKAFEMIRVLELHVKKYERIEE